jgi:hypothetical protein
MISITQARWAQLWSWPWTCPICDVTWVGEESSTCWLCDSPGVLIPTKAPTAGQQIVRWDEILDADGPAGS